MYILSVTGVDGSDAFIDCHDPLDEPARTTSFDGCKKMQALPS